MQYAVTHNLCCSYRQATKSQASSSAAASGRTLILANCKVLDAASGSYLPDLQDIHISSGIIQRICPSGQLDAAAAAGQQQAAAVLDVGGQVVMPGLCDAHVHCTAVTANLAALMAMPESLVTAR